MLNQNANALVTVAATALSFISPHSKDHAVLCQRFASLVHYLGTNRPSGNWSTKFQELKWLIKEIDQEALANPAYLRDGKPVIREKTPYG